MYRFWLVSSFILISFFISGCGNKFYSWVSNDFDLNTDEWRQKYCEKELNDKYGDDYDVVWDSNGENAWWFVIDGLLHMQSGYYDLECQWKDGELELQLIPVGELEYENVYE